MEIFSADIQEPQTFRAAKAALVNSEGRLLILWRSQTDEYRPGGADFPGGEIEDNEDSVEAVIREVKEETTIVLAAESLHKVGSFIKKVDEPGNPLKVVESTVFLAYVENPEVHLGEQIEHHAFEWIPIDEVHRRQLLVSSVSKMACLQALLRQQIGDMSLCGQR